MTITGILDWISDILSNIISPTLNTFATNALQCLDRGPRLVYTPLDLELNTPKPGVVRTTEPATERTISGSKFSNHFFKFNWGVKQKGELCKLV